MKTQFTHPGDSQQPTSFGYQPGVNDDPDSRERTVDDELAAGNFGRSTGSSQNTAVNNDLAFLKYDRK